MSDEREMLAEVVRAAVIDWNTIGTEKAAAESDVSRYITDALLASPQFARLIAAAKAEALREVAEAVEKHRDLVSRLGFGDNITEPMADNDTIVHWFEQQGRDANEWIESQLWRNDCYAAGHPDDEDCWEHDPILQAERRGKAEAWDEGWDARNGDSWFGDRNPYRAALTTEPAPTEGEGA